MGAWYIEILTGDRLAQDGTDLYPITWSWSENINEAQALDMTIAYDSRVTAGKYLYLRNDRDDAAWFYGIIKEVSAEFETPRGQIMSFSAVCIMDELTEYDVGKLGIYESGVGDPFAARRIAFAGPNADVGFSGTDIDVELPNLIDNDTGTTVAWPMWTGDGNTKDGKGIDAIYFATRVPIYDAVFQTSVGSGFGTPTSKDVKFEYLRQGTDGAGWTNAGVSINAVTDPDVTPFQTAGTITININNDLSGSIVKSSQSNTYGFWYRLWIESGEVQSQGNMTIQNIRVNKRVAVDDAIGKIITPITGWTTTDTDTAEPVYLELDGGNALKALRVVAKMTGGLFRLGSTASNQLGWLQSSTGGTTSGVTLDEDNIILGGLSARFIDPAATRYTIHGAGIGQNRITGELQDVYAVNPSTFTFDGDTYQYDPTTNILVNQTAETDIGRIIHKSVDIPYISSLYASGQSIDASNQLIRMCVRALSKASKRNRTAYTVRACNITTRIPVGDKVQLVYSNTSHSVNAEFVITSIKRSYSNGLTTFTYELSSDGFFIDADSGKIEESLIETIDKKIQRQPMSAVDLEGATGGGGGAVEHGNHSGEVTSVGMITTLDPTAISNKAAVTAATDDYLLIGDTSDSDNLKKALVSDITGAHGNHTGDVSSSGLVTTISNNVIATAMHIDKNVTFPKIEDINQNTLTGRIASGAGPMTDLSATQVRTILNVEDGANDYSHPNHSGDIVSVADGATTLQAAVISGKATVAAVAGDFLLIWDATDSTLKKVNADDFLSAGSHGNHTGDVTSVGLVTTLEDFTVSTTKIVNSAVTFGKIEDINQNTLVGRIASGSGQMTDLSASQVRTILNIADGANNYSHPNHTGDVTSSGDGATTIGNDVVTFAKMQNISTDRFIGRDSSGTGDPEQLTMATARSMLNVEDGAQVNPTFTDDAITTKNTPLDTNSLGYLRLVRLMVADNAATPSYPIDARTGAAGEIAIGWRNSSNTVIGYMQDVNGRGYIVVRDEAGNICGRMYAYADGGRIDLLNDSGNTKLIHRSNTSDQGNSLYYNQTGDLVLELYGASNGGQAIWKNNSGSAKVNIYALSSSGVIIADLPTTDPSNTDQFWSYNGVVVQSGFTGDAVGATDWQSVTLHSDISSNWTTSSPGEWGELRYRRLNMGQLEIQGSIKRSSSSGWTSNHRVFQAAAGYRPDETRTKTCYFHDPGATDQGYRTAILTIDSSGFVRVTSSWTAAESLVIDTIVSL